MLRTTLFCLLLAGLYSPISAQLNMSFRDSIDYTDATTDVWGYVANDGTEYAIVGLENSVRFVDLSDPDNIVEVASIPGQESRWRDMKTYGEYAYVVADEPGTTEGLTIIDLSDLANGNLSVTHNNYQIDSVSVLLKAHNLYIDTTKGYAFVAGSNVNGGSSLVFDLVSTPGEAIYLNTVGNNYAHDVYVNGNYLYASEINDGRLSIWDITDINNPQEIGAAFTPFTFTHNAWSTPDNQLVFTTDERGNASVAAYDISDPSDPELLDEYRPLYSLGTNTFPHNVHVLDEYLYTSYYTDGVTVVDASDPTNLIEVGNWDTWPNPPGGTQGNWGAYPFLPSGLLLASDRSFGLFVLEPELKRAARLEGTITDAEGGIPLNNVMVEIDAIQTNQGNTDAAGFYTTGLADAGLYEVTFSKEGFDDLTVEVELINGSTVVLDTSLVNFQVRHTFSGNVIEEGTSAGIPAAQILLQGQDEDILLTANEDGIATFDFVPEGSYDVFVTRWGYREDFIEDLFIDGTTNLTFELPLGYQDGFVMDQGWTSIRGTPTGVWTREVPIGTSAFGASANPGFDVEGDIGDLAYVTGNRGGSGGFDDIDDGITILQSPIFDLSNYDPNTTVLSYQYWFFNFGAGGDTGVDLNDPLVVTLSNGDTTVELARYLEGQPGLGWRADTFFIADSIPLTDLMQLTVTASDTGQGNIIEAGLDDFWIDGAIPTSTEQINYSGLEIQLAPNPSDTDFQILYSFPEAPDGEVRVEVMDVLGRPIYQQRLAPFANGILRFGRNFSRGSYFLRILQNEDIIYSTKLLKQ